MNPCSATLGKRKSLSPPCVWQQKANPRQQAGMDKHCRNDICSNNMYWITNYMYFSFRSLSRIICVSVPSSTRLNLVSRLGPLLPCLFLPHLEFWILKIYFCSGGGMLQNGLDQSKKENGVSQSILDRLDSFHPQRSSFNLSYLSEVFFQKKWYIFRDQVVG